jgi:fructokinase
MVKVRNKDIVAITNALTDVIIPATQKEMEMFGKGEITPDYLEQIVASEKRKIKLIPGGSPANVVANASYLGASCGLVGTIGDDEIGELYRKDLKKNKIEDFLESAEGKSGICYTLISPSKERHFLSLLNVSNEFYVPYDVVDFNLFHTSAYELITDKDSVIESIAKVKENNNIVSFDLADENILKGNIEEIIDASFYADIIFANEEETKAFGIENREAYTHCGGIFVSKLGANGSRIYKNSQTIKIPPYECKMVNTNGAGDAYAAGFLVSYLQGEKLVVCGNEASKLAARVCECDGARLK